MGFGIKNLQVRQAAIDINQNHRIHRMPSIRKFSFLDVLVPVFCVVLVVANVISQKFFDFMFLGITWSLNTGTLVLFPIIYIFGDIFVEVWGYATTRYIIWTGFATQILATIMFSLAVALPSSPYFNATEAFARILGVVPSLVIASLVGYWSGSFANSFVMARMKKWMVFWDPTHKWLPLRSICSTIVGEFVDTVVFISIGVLFGVFPTEIYIMLTLTQWIVKTLIETIMTPVTMFVTIKLKEYEQIDMVGVEDGDNYNPFKLRNAASNKISQDSLRTGHQHARLGYVTPQQHCTEASEHIILSPGNWAKKKGKNKVVRVQK